MCATQVQSSRFGKNQKEIWIDASYNPILDLNGRVYKVVKFATDLSGRKAQNAKLADDFESGVKTVVGTVAASAHEMQITAQSLAAARRNKRISNPQPWRPRRKS